MVGQVLQIHGATPYHFEIVEGVIVYYRDIIGVDVSCRIFLDVIEDAMPQFKSYISRRHPHVRWGRASKHDFFIGLTVYPRDYPWIRKLDPEKNFFISHAYDRASRPPNVFYITDIAPRNVFRHCVLPFAGEMLPMTFPPLYIVQGELSGARRDMQALRRILSAEFSVPYRVLLLGRGLEDHSLRRYPQVTVKNDLGFVDFHSEFRSAYGVLPLVTRDTHPQYYTSKLTSSVAYAKAYGLHCVLDKDLQDIYGLPNVSVYTAGKNGIVDAFRRSLSAFPSHGMRTPCTAEARDQQVTGR